MAGLDVDPTSPMDDTSNMNSSPGLSCLIYLFDGSRIKNITVIVYGAQDRQ